MTFGLSNANDRRASAAPRARSAGGPGVCGRTGTRPRTCRPSAARPASNNGRSVNPASPPARDLRTPGFIDLTATCFSSSGPGPPPCSSPAEGTGCFAGGGEILSAARRSGTLTQPGASTIVTKARRRRVHSV